MVFNGRDGHVEAPLSGCEIGGDAGLTVMARVRRSSRGANWDRLIDFGNGEEQENIVLNFQQEMMYEVRGPAGKNQVLAVGASSSIAEEGAGGDGGDAGGGGRGRGASSRGGSTFPENEWIHVSLVHQADGTASIFWNGTCKASGKVWLPQRVKRAKYYVGRSHWRHDPYFSGCISDVHIFDYALSSSDVLRCAHSRTFPTGFHGRPILSLADSWRLVAETRSPARPLRTRPALSWSCNERGCGGVERCSRAYAFGSSVRQPEGAAGRQKLLHSSPHSDAQVEGGDSDDDAADDDGGVGGGGGGEVDVGCPSGGMAGCSGPDGESLHYMTVLSDAEKAAALVQLGIALEMHRSQLEALERLCVAADARLCYREAEILRQRIADSTDALRRAQAVATMIRNGPRLPTGMRHELSTGQLRQPPRLAAALDPASGMYHTYAIYELRSGDVSRGCRFHVYVTDLFNMRSLLPFQTCWRPSVASFLISLLQTHADAEQPVVVLRALSNAPRLEGYYERIGFTSERAAFDAAGLSESFVKGDLLFHSEPAVAHEPVSMVEMPPHAADATAAAADTAADTAAVTAADADADAAADAADALGADDGSSRAAGGSAAGALSAGGGSVGGGSVGGGGSTATTVATAEAATAEAAGDAVMALSALSRADDEALELRFLASRCEAVDDEEEG